METFTQISLCHGAALIFWSFFLVFFFFFFFFFSATRTPNSQNHSYVHHPNLRFLVFVDFLAFFFSKEFLVFLILFLSFPGIVGVRRREQNPCFFGGFLCLSPKKKEGKEDQAIHYVNSRANGSRITPITFTYSLQSREEWPLRS